MSDILDNPNDDISKLLNSPIGCWLGLSAMRDADGVYLRATFSEQHIGNSIIRALHGGVVAAVMEHAAQVTLTDAAGSSDGIGAINGDVDYVRSMKKILTSFKFVKVGDEYESDSRESLLSLFTYGPTQV